MAIVLASAFLHAGWNFLLKKSGNKIVFTWCFLTAALVMYLPVCLYFWPRQPISTLGWVCIAGTGIFHFLYFWFMGGAYERGDLSLVYPLFRGSGPLLVPILAVLLLNEELAALGLAGIGLIVLGIYVLHLTSFRLQSFLEPFASLKQGASRWALYTGGAIAGYSIIDKVGVGQVFPPVYLYLAVVISWGFLSVDVLSRRREGILLEWRHNRLNIVVVGFFAIFTYMMILFALQLAKVSYVSAVREISIVLSALLGVSQLGEKNAAQKLPGAAMIALGVVFIGLSR